MSVNTKGLFSLYLVNRALRHYWFDRKFNLYSTVSGRLRHIGETYDSVPYTNLKLNGIRYNRNALIESVVQHPAWKQYCSENSILEHEDDYTKIYTPKDNPQPVLSAKPNDSDKSETAVKSTHKSYFAVARLDVNGWPCEIFNKIFGEDDKTELLDTIESRVRSSPGVTYAAVKIDICVTAINDGITWTYLNSDALSPEGITNKNIINLKSFIDNKYRQKTDAVSDLSIFDDIVYGISESYGAPRDTVKNLLKSRFKELGVI
jgi:hypothetical protein